MLREGRKSDSRDLSVSDWRMKLWKEEMVWRLKPCFRYTEWERGASGRRH